MQMILFLSLDSAFCFPPESFQFVVEILIYKKKKKIAQSKLHLRILLFNKLVCVCVCVCVWFAQLPPTGMA